MNRRLPYLLLAPGAAAIVIVMLLPIGRTFSTTVAGQTPVWALYAAALSDPFTLQVLWRTLRIALISTAIAAVVGFPTAYVVARSSAARKGLLITFAVFPLLTNPVVRSFAWMVILGRNGLATTRC